MSGTLNAFKVQLVDQRVRVVLFTRTNKTIYARFWVNGAQYSLSTGQRTERDARRRANTPHQPHSSHPPHLFTRYNPKKPTHCIYTTTRYDKSLLKAPPVPVAQLDRALVS